MFKTLKHQMSQELILHQADPTVPFILDVDASDCALGAILSQKEGDKERVIEFASCTLNTS